MIIKNLCHLNSLYFKLNNRLNNYQAHLLRKNFYKDEIYGSNKKVLERSEKSRRIIH
jgi:hypothetical protein